MGRSGLMSMESLPAFDRFVAVSSSLSFNSLSVRFRGGRETGRLWDGFVEYEALNNDISEGLVVGLVSPFGLVMFSARVAPITPIVAARMSVKPLDAETTEVSAAELVPLIIPA